MPTGADHVFLPFLPPFLCGKRPDSHWTMVLAIATLRGCSDFWEFFAATGCLTTSRLRLYTKNGCFSCGADGASRKPPFNL
jgi:hypothetical protein